MTFDDEPQIVQGFTGDAGALRDQITKTRAGGGTAIYDAIYEACVKELIHPPSPPGDQPDVVRRVHDSHQRWRDNLSTHTRADAIEMAQRTSVVIYTISTSTNGFPSRKPIQARWATQVSPHGRRQILQELAENRRPRVFFLITWTISISRPGHRDELRNQYSVASPTNYVLDGRYHKIRIEVPEHKGLPGPRASRLLRPRQRECSHDAHPGGAEIK